ncbi:MAG: NAD(P)H-hydrate dehydratase [Bacteroidetes bacterium]|nr:NAD(P)H-hydrate dehydratase [Bacteroidota bacterium]
MKILSAAQIRLADQYTIANEPISSIDLMERAALACFDWLVNHYSQATFITVYCGHGNNGGDGLAIARLLTIAGKTVRVMILTGGEPSPDFAENLNRLKKLKTEIVELSESKSIPVNNNCDLIIDAIFGTGIKRKVGEWHGEIIQHINSSKCPIVSIDMPSGLRADEPSEGEIVKATYTLTFQQPKLSFFFPENGAYTGKWICLDIGLSKEYLNSQISEYYLTDKDYVDAHFKSRSVFSHKGSFGHSLLIAGSRGKYGAAILAARACVRSGSGLLTMHVPSEASMLIHQSCPEAMVDADLHPEFLSSVSSLEKYTAIGIGPGLGTRSETANAFLDLLPNYERPMVIDADALNILSENPSFIEHLPKNSILTPHLKEFARLIGESTNGFERLKKQVDFAMKHQLIIVLKGAFTAIALPDGRVYFNSTGNPGLAKGGSGDVLTGFCTGFLAQGYSPEEAAVLAVYYHGLSADKVVLDRPDFSITPSDIIDYFGKIIA